METLFEDLMWTEKIWIDEEMFMISEKIPYSYKLFAGQIIAGQMFAN